MKAKKLKISRVLHAGYVFEQNDTQIIFDPIFENPFSFNCYAYPSVEFNLNEIKKLKLNAIFISHYHDDHCSFESLHLLDKSTPIYMYCAFAEMFTLLQELGFKKIHSLRLDTKVTIGPFEVTPRRALDEDVDCLFHVQVADMNILNVVDSWIAPDTLKQLKSLNTWDLIMWPFQTMREIAMLSPLRAEAADRNIPYEWVEQLKVLNPQYLIPSSCQFIQEEWSWYRQAYFPISYKNFSSQLSSVVPKTQIFKLNPSESIFLSQEGLEKAPPLAWIETLGAQDLDYSFNEASVAQSTCFIAQQLSLHTDEQLKSVIEYCNKSLAKRYKELALIEDSYFLVNRNWQLSVYLKNGQALVFNFVIHESDIKLIDDIDFVPHWTSEIPLVKLYSALYEGESLSSIYIRINDQKMSPQVEAELLNQDILQDPLLRCLYEGYFGSYQKAQLIKILKLK